MSSKNPYSLLRLIYAGDVKAYQKFYEYHFNTVYLFVLPYLKSEELAKDLCQDIFIKIWTKRSHLEHIEDDHAYLIKLSKNMAIDFLRKAASEASMREKIKTAGLLLQSQVRSPEDERIAKEILSLRNTILQQLPDRSRRVFELCKEDGLSYEKAGTILGISKNGIKKHLVKIHKLFREAFIKEGLLFYIAICFLH